MTTRIKTPHAAIKIWNYTDRVGIAGSKPERVDQINEEIISTVSCTGIQTFKSKSDPVGTFNFSLAPTRNWVSVITPGSWCVILMSNDPITKDSFRVADKKLVKMFGKIESVRAQVDVDSNGARQTVFLVSGQDWGHIFNNILYVDPLISDEKDNLGDQGNALYLQLIHSLLGENGTAVPGNITNNLQTLLSVFGDTLKIPETTRLAKATHSIRMPLELVKFFKFVNSENEESKTPEVTKTIAIKSGKLTADGAYEKVNDGLGWLNPYCLVGTHSLWQIMQDNANYALNEMLTEINWLGNGPQLTLFNRIKPFSFQNTPPEGCAVDLRSKFQDIPHHRIDDALIISVNAGTSWKDKINFIEIKPSMEEFKTHDGWNKAKCQAYDRDNNSTFDREGFRPLIFSIKQIPIKEGDKDISGFQPNRLQPWTLLLKEWYFDSHRLLNGQITMTGSTEYIAVGNNVMFDAGLLNITPNYNSKTNNKGKYYVLGHIESVKHNFSINGDARSYQTTIQFVRGIIVDGQKNIVGDGAIDSINTEYTKEMSSNTSNTVIAMDDPSKE